jgi:hypothetical protein
MKRSLRLIGESSTWTGAPANNRHGGYADLDPYSSMGSEGMRSADRVAITSHLS